MWMFVMESVGIETHVEVAGRIIDKEVEGVTVTVQSAVETDR